MNTFFEKVVNKLTSQKISEGLTDIKMVSNWMNVGEEYYDHLQTKIPFPGTEKIICHTYWYGSFGRKQAFSVKSFLATQNLDKVELWLWLDEESGYDNYETNPYIKEILPLIKVKHYNPHKDLVGSRFEKYSWIFVQEKRLANRADGLRLWALTKFGGFYFDLDVMFCRDMTDLFYGPEFVYAWEFQPYANSAIMYLRKGSYLSDYIQKKVIRKLTTLPWVIFHYKDKNMKSMCVYPATYFDPLWCTDVNSEEIDFPITEFLQFFEEFGKTHLKKIHSYRDWFKGIYAYHWHNCWKAAEVENSYFGIFEKEYNEIVKRLLG